MTKLFQIDSRDIVLADPHYGDQRQSKVRPLLVISKNNFHNESGFFVCVGITTNQQHDPYLVPIRQDSLENVDLKEQSQVMCKRIVTVRSDRVIKRIDNVTDDFYKLVTEKIKNDILDI